MEWPGQPVLVQAVRPGRGRPRLNSEHPARPLYVADNNGMLVPAAPAGGEPMYRTQSNRERPTSVVIHNSWDDHSPVRHHRRGSHGHEYYYDDEYSDYDHIPRQRHRSRSHHGPSPSRSPSPRYYDPALADKLKKLDDMEKAEEEKARAKAAEERKRIEEIEKKEREKAQREKYEQDQILEAAKKKRKEEEDKKLREEWIEQWKRDEQDKKKKEEEKKKKEEEEFRLKTFETFRKAGVSDREIEKILKKADKSDRKKDGLKERTKHHHGDEGKQLMRSPYIKVHRKYMSTDTLDEYELPWELEPDTEYIIIKKWVNEHDQEELFRHTAKLRERKARKKVEDTAVELRKDKGGNLCLVGKKGEGRSRSRSRSWLFT